MKENLLQKLDLLEVQLAQANSSEVEGKLSSTKRLLEKLSKSGARLPPAHELESEILKTKQEIANRKHFYAVNVVKRYLKTFKKLEPLKIAKRAKAADNEEKKAMLNEEESIIKQFDIDEWAADVINRFLFKKMAIQDVFGFDYTRRKLDVAESNIFGRIGKADPVKKAQQQLYESLSPLFPDSMEFKESETLQSEKDVKSKDNIKEPKESDKEKVPMNDFTEFEEENDEDINEDVGKAKPEKYDPFFDQDILVDSDSDDNGNLPSLNQGYISGSDSEVEDIEEVKPVRKNRRGQRARQKIWEQKYGQKANHVIKQQKEEDKLKREKELKRKRKEEQYAKVKRRKQEFESKPIHPSWEALKKQKEKQENVKFTGKKISFD